jgi:hypothetical protein
MVLAKKTRRSAERAALGWANEAERREKRVGSAMEELKAQFGDLARGNCWIAGCGFWIAD